MSIDLELHADVDFRILSIWLTNAELQDSTTMQQIKPTCDRYRKQKYKVAIFRSGNGDLLHNTQSLLLHNRYPKSASHNS